MKRIDTTTKYTDKFGSGKHGWRDGDKPNGIPATQFNAGMMDNIQEEICAVIEGAGIALDGGDMTQLKQAIVAMIETCVANDFKASVRIATTDNIASLTGLAAIDGVTPIAGDRILVKDQTTGSQNGIYVAAAGAWSRATDADTGAELNGGALVSVEEGTTNAEAIWALANDGTVTIGTTALVFQWAAGLNGVTAAQFDNSRKLATTAFVQRALGSYRGCETVATNLALNAGHVGTVVRNNGANTITLPLASSVVPGAAIIIANQDGGAPCIVQRAGAENIERNGSGVNSVTLNFGENVTLVATNSSSWTVVNGLGTASLAAAGYQKLPDGLIIQWGSGTTAVGGGAITFPIAFPTACRGVQVTNQVTGAPTSYLGRGAPSTTGFSCWNNANTAGTGFDWFAVGH